MSMYDKASNKLTSLVKSKGYDKQHYTNDDFEVNEANPSFIDIKNWLSKEYDVEITFKRYLNKSYKIEIQKGNGKKITSGRCKSIDDLLCIYVALITK